MARRLRLVGPWRIRTNPRDRGRSGPPWAHARAHLHRWPRRVLDERLVGGVAGGLAATLGVDVTLVRVGVVLAALAGGIGLAAYVIAWLLFPAAGAERSIAATSAGDRPGLAAAAAVLPLAVVLPLVGSALRLGALSGLAWPLTVTASGLVLVWRNGAPQDRVVLDRLSPGGRHRRLGWRLVAGAALVLAGLVVSASVSAAALEPLGGIALVLAGVVVVFAPWWLRVARVLASERAARRRAEEAAELAARVHDSVLQTLSLIQRASGEPAEVLRLARAQERELRAVLFDGPSASGPTGLASALAAVEEDVEAAYDIRVEVVVVGDRPLDPGVAALVAAGREAVVNAAKWSTAPTVSVYAEVACDGGVTLYVRDRGVGFEPATVGPGHHGLRYSLAGRMARAGGTSQVRSAPGEGTEVVLTVPA